MCFSSVSHHLVKASYRGNLRQTFIRNGFRIVLSRPAPESVCEPEPQKDQHNDGNDNLHNLFKRVQSKPLVFLFFQVFDNLSEPSFERIVRCLVIVWGIHPGPCIIIEVSPTVLTIVDIDEVMFESTRPSLSGKYHNIDPSTCCNGNSLRF